MTATTSQHRNLCNLVSFARIKLKFDAVAAESHLKYVLWASNFTRSCIIAWITRFTRFDQNAKTLTCLGLNFCHERWRAMFPVWNARPLISLWDESTKCELRALRFHASSCSTPPCPPQISNPLKKPQIKSTKHFNMWPSSLQKKGGN